MFSNFCHVVKGLNNAFSIGENKIIVKGATSDEPVAPFASSDSEAAFDCLFQRLPLFFEPLEHSLSSEMKAIVVVIGRVSLDLHFDISDINIFLFITHQFSDDK